jgi:Protein of unknown function (DUF3617)
MVDKHAWLNETMSAAILLRVVLLCSILGSAQLLLAKPLNLAPGRYNFTVTYELNGHPSGGANKQTRCLTPADIRNPERVFNDRLLATFKDTAACTVRNFKTTGSAIAYDANCGVRTAHVEGTVHAADFSIVREIQSKSAPMEPLTVRIAAKRVGQCKR